MSSRLATPVRVRALCAALTVPFAPGCSHMARIAAGPVAAYPDEKPSYGGELRVQGGAGTSDAEDAAFLEVGGRLLVTERTQALGAGVGPAYLLWLGPSAFRAAVMPGLGVERYLDKAFMNFSLHGSLGTALVVREDVRRDRSWDFAAPERLGLPPDHRITLLRTRTLVTLDVTGNLDARTTREPLYGLGILIGFARVSESYAIEAPEPPGLTPFGW
jgi:hypothetical protein